jgi:hypothetical protein
MRTNLCRHCNQHWPLLDDGTLVEHAQPDHGYFRCPGSRTRAQADDALDERAAVHEPHRRDERRYVSFVSN